METNELYEWVIKRDDEPDLKFEGYLVASATSKTNTRQIGRWTELRLYQTAKGKYVCEELGMTQWEGEQTRRRVVVVELVEDVIDFFGYGWLAKDLLVRADMLIPEEIE